MRERVRSKKTMIKRLTDFLYFIPTCISYYSSTLVPECFLYCLCESWYMPILFIPQRV